MGRRSRARRDEWTALVLEAAKLGYRVEVVQYVECADCPGILGMAHGAIIYGKKYIRIKESLNAGERCEVLRHELRHARNPDADIEEGPVWFLSATGRRRSA